MSYLWATVARGRAGEGPPQASRDMVCDTLHAVPLTVGRAKIVLSALAGLLAGCIEVGEGPAPTKARANPAPDTVPETFEAGPPNGFSEQIAWRTLDDGLRAMKEQGRPMMLVVHASWCPRCKELKPAFDQPEIAALSKRFAMVNVDQDEVPAAQEYAPDGTYIPRVLFFDPKTGTVDEELLNGQRQEFKYFYTPGDDLAAAMRGALARHDRT